MADGDSPPQQRGRNPGERREPPQSLAPLILTVAADVGAGQAHHRRTARVQQLVGDESGGRCVVAFHGGGAPKADGGRAPDLAVSKKSSRDRSSRRAWLPKRCAGVLQLPRV